MMTSLVVFMGFLQVVAGQPALYAAPPVAPLAPVAPVLPAVPTECINYMAGVGCQWTARYSCPGQVYGSQGRTSPDGSHGYMCCCEKELFKYATPVTAPPVTPPGSGLVTPPPPVTAPPVTSDPGFVHWKRGFTLEGIPNYVYQQKYKLLRWFEDNSQCPLNDNVGFPAWIGWKSVMAAGGAVTTPAQGIAGNRTLQVNGFCPKIPSSGFKCVEEGNELKARVVGASAITIKLDGLICELKDITLFKTSPNNQMGLRLDFATCTGDINLGYMSPHVPKTATIRMGVRDKQQEDEESNLGNFFKGVCAGGSPADIYTAQLPKSMYPRKPGLETKGQPACFAHSANSLHVMGKSCFEDFLFMDWLAPPPVDPATGFPRWGLDPVLASFPTKDYDLLKSMIPSYQPQYNEKIASQLKASPSTPAPTPAPTTPPSTGTNYRIKVCGSVYVCQPGTHRIPGSTNKNCDGEFCQPSECCQSNRRLGAPVTPPPGPPATCACSEGGFLGTQFCNPFRCPPGSTLDPQAASISCETRTGCTKADTHRCCMLQTTTTTTAVGEVPGVVVADRLCIQLSNCGSCDNDCDCVNVQTVANTTAFQALNAVPTPAAEIPQVVWCKEYWIEVMMIALFALMPMVFLSTLCLKSWAINAHYERYGREEGHGHDSSPMETVNWANGKGGSYTKREPSKAHVVYEPGTATHKHGSQGGRGISLMTSLTKYTSLGTSSATDNQPHELDSERKFGPAAGYSKKNKHDPESFGISDKLGAERLRVLNHHYLRHSPLTISLVNLLSVMVFSFVCIALAFWPVSWIMTYWSDADYVFPICLPLLPICPTGLLPPNCGATATTWLYNPDCVCSTSLVGLGLALGFTCWWGHYLFWISKRVKHETSDCAGTAAQIYAKHEDVDHPSNGRAGPVRYMASFLY